VNDDSNQLPADLRAFIDQLIVPLLVELVKNGHLYNAEATRYDEETGASARAA
jgi:hypothetical protein